MLARRTFLLGSGAALAAFAAPLPARATLARALPLRELLHQSQHTLVATAVDGFSEWEIVGGGRRIVTYTTLRVETSLDGRPQSSDSLRVRTLGGIVGDLGQVVPGEAQLARGEPAAVFVEQLGREVYAVTAMAQGHFPLLADSRGARRLRRAASLVGLVGGPGAAVHRLHGLTVVDAERLIAKELEVARP